MYITEEAFEQLMQTCREVEELDLELNAALVDLESVGICADGFREAVRKAVEEIVRLRRIAEHAPDVQPN